MRLPQTRADWLILAALVAVLGTIWIGATRVQADELNPTGRPPSADRGHPAPDFTLSALDGEPVSLSQFRGRPVILNFWATWCGPCRAEIPALEAAWRGAAGEAVVVGVNVQEDEITVGRFARELGMTYPVVLDTAGEIARIYRVQAFPTTYFIDARGVIAENYIGPMNAPLLLSRMRDLALAGE